MLLVLFSFSAPLIHAQGHVSCRVYDSSTGQSVPFVRAAGGDGACAWSNDEGVVTLSAPVGDTLQLSCPGYETQRVVAGHDTCRVLLSPVDGSDGGTLVDEAEARDILHRVAMQMQADMKAHKKDLTRYCIRQENEVEGNTHLVEGVLSARGAVALAHAKMLGGNHYCAVDNCQPLKYSNLHYTLSLGPVARWGDLWANLTLPLMTAKPHGRRFLYETDYLVECRLLRAHDGAPALYRFVLTHNPRTPSLRFVHGTLLVDAATLRPVRFEGDTEGLEMKLHSHIGWRNVPMSVHMLIGYTTAGGYLEVEHMGTWCRCEDISCVTSIVSTSAQDVPGRLFPNDRANMLNRHVYARKADAGSYDMPLARTARQDSLVGGGVKGCTMKTFTRF